MTTHHDERFRPGRAGRAEADEIPWIRRNPVAAVVLVVIAVAAVVLLGRGDSRPEEPGRQLSSPTSRVRGPGTRVWIELTPADGEVREGWPPPMIARGDLLCFGFGRLDFGSPTRPTLARCVESSDIPELPPRGIVSLVVVQAGADTWHLLMAGSDVESAALTDAAGDELDQGRVHIDGDLVALRLAATVELDELSWIVGRTRYVCDPAPDAARTAVFCGAGVPRPR